VRIRRSQHDVRIETMPLIDVVFLLLTFFIYAVAVMDRVDALPMETAPPRGGAGRRGARGGPPRPRPERDNP